MKTSRITNGNYKVEHKGKTWKVTKEDKYWRAEDGTSALGSKTKKGVLKGIKEDYSELIFNEWL